MSARRPGRITVTVDHPEEIFDPVILAALQAGRRVTAAEELDIRRRHTAELTAGPAVCCRACGFALTGQHQACPSIVLMDSRSLRPGGPERPAGRRPGHRSRSRVQAVYTELAQQNIQPAVGQRTADAA
ncbi:hypothetical protein [Candidatus Frankia alpina]|uniref:Uncharacterized protein n=1 Tax=Candidatus Frankia alpina TaxID=2699483 RepID=A0A4S5CD63_9ACTN|nr:hypothetical protein [Candidatus Frankia alpina]THJ43734.1 hypothetical protein E7Y31_20310 [Candidatus Frankia alpina]